MHVQTHRQAPAVHLWAAQTPWLLPGSCLIAGLLQAGLAGKSTAVAHGSCSALSLTATSLPVVCSQQGVKQWGDAVFWWLMKETQGERAKGSWVGFCCKGGGMADVFKGAIGEKNAQH